MTVIGKSEWMDDGVEMDDGQHDGKNDQGRQYSGEPLLLFGKSIVKECRYHRVWKHQIDDWENQDGPREEQEIRPDIEHLREMQTCGVKLFMS
jgi:hypothetical protein